jgi:hypothetical protein
MCIIVDANAAHDLKNQTADGKPVLSWLLRGRGGLVAGGRLTSELVSAGLGETLATLARAGRFSRVPDDQVDRAEAFLQELGLCRSNDLHVLAVAVVSKCRLIYTKDRALHRDAKNRSVLEPAADIYQNAAHSHLLRECRCS